MNGWYFAGFCLLAYILIWIWYEQKRRKGFAKLAKKRSNLSKDEFVAALAPDIDSGISIWLQYKISEYIEPELSPHPNDNIIIELYIDDEESSDWFLEFCEDFNYDPEQAPDWPSGQDMTVRNFASWLNEVRLSAT